MYFATSASCAPQVISIRAERYYIMIDIVSLTDK